MISVYAVVDSPAVDVSDLRGIEGASLVRVPHAGIAAVGSTHDEGADLSPQPERLWRHDGVVASLMGRCTVVPTRYGTVFADAAALGELLAAEHRRLVRSLDSMRGRVELGVRGALTGPARPSPATETVGATGQATASSPPAGGAGSAYLRARHAALAERRPLDDVHAELARLADRSTVRFEADGTMVAAYLLAEDDAGRLKAAIADLDAGDERVTLSVTGPWAGYSFVDGPGDG